MKDELGHLGFNNFLLTVLPVRPGTRPADSSNLNKPRQGPPGRPNDDHEDQQDDREERQPRENAALRGRTRPLCIRPSETSPLPSLVIGVSFVPFHPSTIMPSRSLCVDLYFTLGTETLKVLAIPRDQIDEYNFRPLKWLRFVGYAIYGAEGDIYPMEGGQHVNYDSVTEAVELADSYCFISLRMSVIFLAINFCAQPRHFMQTTHI